MGLTMVAVRSSAATLSLVAIVFGVIGMYSQAEPLVQPHTEILPFVVLCVYMSGIIPSCVVTGLLLLASSHLRPDSSKMLAAVFVGALIVTAAWSLKFGRAIGI